ncbi:MAG: aminoacyl-tRNA hydrolase [Clostridia bacterium]|nr:aminoacyl-tRNA hydrolase [Clostridia bacterium]
MKLIVGLGNPGSEYQSTRHNMGFAAIDYISEKQGISVKKSKHQALIGEGTLGGERVVLVKPMTYMNLSGDAVSALARWYKVEPADILVIYDDMDLPVGQMRLRPSGSAGGHNGMKSIILRLSSDQFPRLRIGIGRRENNDTIDYVLGKLNREEQEIQFKLLGDVCDAVVMFVQNGLEPAMNRYNRKPSKES